MWKATWRRVGLSALPAIGLVFLLPTLAQAQLFPNRTIRRERPPCASEPPFNAQVRRDYFGYYPTCWSRFPQGWACPCPNPEAPSQLYAESYKKYPFNPKPSLSDDDRAPGMDEEGPGGERRPTDPAGDTPAIPLPNNGRSPFDLDANPKPTTPPAGDPFTDPKPPATNPGGAARPSTSGLMEMPKIPSTSPTTTYESPLKPGSMDLAPEATLASSDVSDARPDLGSLPNAPIPPSSVAMASPPTEGLPPSMPAPAQAPRRKGLLSGLFGKGNTRTR